MEDLDGYKVDTRDLLGRGGFGEVFVAIDSKGERVAAKRVWLKTTSLREILEEVKTLKTVKPHKHILKYFDSQRSRDFLWIFTEYCEQGDLSQYCAMHELEFAHKLDISHQCASAIAHLHNLSPPVAHRDIKPNNILMTHNAQNKIEIKLADFGLAKTAGGHAKTLAMRTLCGTEAYMAPEHFFMERRVAPPYGKSVDIFALGLVFAGLLDAIPGKQLLPIQVRGLPLGQVMYNLQEASFPVWCPVMLDIDDHPVMLELKALFSAMLSHTPESRPTAAKTQANLKHLLGIAPKPSSLLPKNISSNGASNEDFFFNELTSEPTVVKNTAVKRQPAAKKRREFKSQTRNLDLRATMDFGSALRRRGPSHKIVIVGGTVGYNVSDVCWLLDTPEDGFFWRCFAEVPKDMRQQYGYSVCAVDDKSFVMLGGGSSTSVATGCFRYRIKSEVWEKLPNILVARGSAGLVCLNNVLYLVGGEGSRQTILRSCEKLDLTTAAARQRWEKCQDMPQPMVFPLVASAGEGVYVVSNTHRDNKVKAGVPLKLQCYDPKKSSWRFQTQLPSRVRDTSGASVIGDGGQLYLIGGWEKLCLRYDVCVDAWTVLTPCPNVHSFAAVCCAGGKINVFGGSDETGGCTKVTEYEINEDVWRVRTLEMPEAIVHHHALVLKM